MQLLYEIGWLLKSGDRVLDHLALLRGKIFEHHALYVQLYGIGACVPKIHQLDHVPDAMQRHGRNLDCRPMEYMHCRTKAAHIHQLTSVGMECSMIRRLTAQVIHEL